MATPGNKRLLEWGSIIVAIVLIAAGVIYYKHFYNPQEPTERTEVDIVTLPDRFPADIPLEQDAGIIENYTASGPGVLFQATRTFTSAATAAQNMAKYQSFFSGENWGIIAASSSEQYSFLIATNTPLHLQATVFVSEESATGSKVDITVTPLSQESSSEQ